MTDRPLLPVSFYYDKETDEVVFVYPEEKTERIPVDEMIERMRPRTLSELLDPYRGVYKLTPKQKTIFISEGATNGEVLEKVFPMSEIIFDGLQEGYINFCMVSNPETMNCVSKEWWNAPYKTESEAAEQ